MLNAASVIAFAGAAFIWFRASNLDIPHPDDAAALLGVLRTQTQLMSVAAAWAGVGMTADAAGLVLIYFAAVE